MIQTWGFIGLAVLVAALTALYTQWQERQSGEDTALVPIPIPVEDEHAN